MTTIIALIIAGMVLEGAGLAAYHRLTGRGPAPAALLPNLAAGAMLLLAMLFVLNGAGWWRVSACLLGALAGHVVDMRRRWPN